MPCIYAILSKVDLVAVPILHMFFKSNFKLKITEGSKCLRLLLKIKPLSYLQNSKPETPALVALSLDALVRAARCCQCFMRRLALYKINVVLCIWHCMYCVDIQKKALQKMTDCNFTAESAAQVNAEYSNHLRRISLSASSRAKWLPSVQVHQPVIHSDRYVIICQ